MLLDLPTTTSPTYTHTARQRPSIHPATLVRSLTDNSDLIWQMTRREVLGRYRGSALGILWSFFHPLLMLAVYTFAFSYIFKAHLNPTRSGPEPMTDYALFAFAGLILLWIFSETVTRAPSLILANVSYVKKVIFPVEILPWITLFSALIHALISTLVLLLAHLVINHQLHWTCILFPLVLAPFLLMIMGIAWFLTSLGVYLRDVAQTISLLTMVLMYLSPVFYPLDRIDNRTMLFFIRLNPITLPVEEARALLLRGEIPGIRSFLIYVAGSLVTCYLGFAWFQRTKRGFADVV